jgi:hypothetical protein
VTILDVLPKLTERRWQKQVLDLAALFGWGAWHDRATNFPRRCPSCKVDLRMIRNDPGWPDLFLVRDDTLIVAELKTDRNYPTPAQRAWLDALRRVRRIVVVVWKPRDVERVTEALR